MPSSPQWSVAFADGTGALVAPARRYRCAALARLALATGSSLPAQAAHALHVEAVFDRRLAFPGGFVRLLKGRSEMDLRCVLGPVSGSTQRSHQMASVAGIAVRQTQRQGGLLVHGALAQVHGSGVVFAGPSGAGKSTVSRLLPPPWQSLCDDAVLLVRAVDGVRAHPWPTWSALRAGKQRTWNTNDSVPLKAILFLAQSSEDRIESCGCAATAIRITESAEQVSRTIPRFPGDSTRALRLERFASACALAGQVPSALLHFTLDGPFWRLVEDFMKAHHGRAD